MVKEVFPMRYSNKPCCTLEKNWESYFLNNPRRLIQQMNIDIYIYAIFLVKLLSITRLDSLLKENN